METKTQILVMIFALPFLFFGLFITTELLSFTEFKLYNESNLTISAVGFCEVENLGDYSHTILSAGNCEINGNDFMIKKDEHGKFELKEMDRKT